MKRFLINIIFFLFCLVILDVFVGFVSDRLSASANGGSTKENHYIAKESCDDVIILGSSRAKHHYNPFIIEDSLGLSCYNMGLDGNGIVLAYGRYKMLLERYTPKLIIYEVSPSFDFYIYDENSRYLTNLRQYYDVEGVKIIVDQIIDKKERIKMHSIMYRNNSRILPAVIDNIISRDVHKGYIPLYGVVTDSTRYEYQVVDSISWELDSVKLSLFEKFVCDTKAREIPLVMFVSPVYAQSARVDYVEAEKICAKYDVPFYYLMEMDGVVDDCTMFQDRTHMNNIGAEKYTREIIPLLRKELNN